VYKIIRLFLARGLFFHFFFFFGGGGGGGGGGGVVWYRRFRFIILESEIYK
jgi:hypothetical protein